MSKIKVDAFFDNGTNTVTYIAVDVATGLCAIIDPVLDYQANSGRTSTESADKIVSHIDKFGYKVEWILETHAHADHLTAAPYLKAKLGGSIGIGEHIVRVQSTFKKLFNLQDEFVTDGHQFDHLFSDDEKFRLGHLDVRVMHTPGHTPACVSYLVEDCAFVGDTLFMPDYGTTRIFVGHDYLPKGRSEFVWETSVLEQKRHNIHVHEGISQQDFVTMRETRDAGLDVSKLLLPAIQINIRGGELPPAEANGQRYLKIPLNLL
jgi:glyoxylase-like metal-dependent hydrolase (beta-lactamase superfamily II)